jgi:hypothetical protein
MDKGMYSDTASFVADVRLVWDNAKSYNAIGTSVHNCAQKLEDLFEKELRKACGGVRAARAIARGRETGARGAWTAVG